jgi:hypothetical protein
LRENFRIRVRKGDSEIEVEGTENFVIEQLSKLTRLLKTTRDQGIVREEKRISLVELFDEKLPQKHTEEIALFAYYMDKVLREPYFNVSDINELYTKSKIKGPANINDTINALVRKGILMESDEEKESLKCWTITRSGIELVESGMEAK